LFFRTDYVVENKDFTKSVTVSSNDEIGKIKTSFNSLMDYMNEVIALSKSSSNENSNVSKELTHSAEDIVEKVHNTTTIVNSTVEKNISLKDVIEESLIASQNTETNISNAQEKMNLAKNEIIALTDSVMQSNDSQLELSQKLDDLSREADQVKDVLSIISDIADQTNLLALNAAIEAARAGEHGRGFAVVADEVRKLAERTQKTLSEINITVNSIVQAISDSSNQIVENTKEFESLVKTSEVVSHTISESSNLMDETTISVHKSSEISHNIENTIGSFVEDMNNIKVLMSSNISSSKEITDSSHHLFDLTNELSTTLNNYKTK
jgi:methyl-accepting chemotaxis protein